MLLQETHLKKRVSKQYAFRDWAAKFAVTDVSVTSTDIFKRSATKDVSVRNASKDVYVKNASNI
jgi:hypothetical protein